MRFSGNIIVIISTDGRVRPDVWGHHRIRDIGCSPVFVACRRHQCTTDEEKVVCEQRIGGRSPRVAIGAETDRDRVRQRVARVTAAGC
ncbi:MAG TPA: hypothetical protein VJQ82_17540 [Terriglobales bacterium]|nr:hypothetical protein [Terriglobales bacterium]